MTYRARGTAGHRWGLGEAAVGWVSAQVIGSVALLAMLVAGGWSLFTPARPGGHIGRAAGQLRAGVPLENDSVPLLVQLVALVPSWAALLGGAWFLAGLRGVERPGWRITWRPLDVPIGVATAIGLQVFAVPALYLIIEAVFGEFVPSARAITLVDQVDSPLAAVTIVLFVAVGAPVVEELFYRGLVQRSLVDRFGPGIGIGVSGLLFGAVHLSLIELPALTLVGWAFGWLYWRTGRLGPAVAGHIAFNLFTLVLLFVLA